MNSTVWHNSIIYRIMHDDYYFSVDRLVEFGLGMAMAQQMVEMFNKSMIPVLHTVSNQQNQPTPMIYVAVDNKALGPVHMHEIVTLFRNKDINMKSLAWMPGMPQWKAIEDIPEILRTLALTPPPLPKTEY